MSNPTAEHFHVTGVGTAFLERFIDEPCWTTSNRFEEIAMGIAGDEVMAEEQEKKEHDGHYFEGERKTKRWSPFIVQWWGRGDIWDDHVQRAIIPLCMCVLSKSRSRSISMEDAEKARDHFECYEIILHTNHVSQEVRRWRFLPAEPLSWTFEQQFCILFLQASLINCESADRTENVFYSNEIVHAQKTLFIHAIRFFRDKTEDLIEALPPSPGEDTWFSSGIRGMIMDTTILSAIVEYDITYSVQNTVGWPSRWTTWGSRGCSGRGFSGCWCGARTRRHNAVWLVSE